MNNFFLVIEGPDGAGKGEVCKELQALLTVNHINTIMTREPQCRDIIDLVHESIIKNSADSVREIAELMARDRQIHSGYLSYLIEAANTTDLNQVIICDRYFSSSMVYQNMYPRKKKQSYVELDVLMELNKHMLHPDLEIIMTPSLFELQRRLQFKSPRNRVLNPEIVMRCYEELFLLYKKQEWWPVEFIKSDEAVIVANKIFGILKNKVNFI